MEIYMGNLPYSATEEEVAVVATKVAAAATTIGDHPIALKPFPAPDFFIGCGCFRLNCEDRPAGRVG